MREGDPEREADAGRDRLRRVPREVRDAVFRPDAVDGDRRALARALADLDPQPAQDPPTGRRRGRRWVPAAVLLAALLAAALLGQQGGGARAPGRTTPVARPAGAALVQSEPVPLLGDLEDQQRQQVAIEQLLAARRAVDLRAFLLEHHFDGAIAAPGGERTVIGSSVGTHSYDIGLLAAPPRPKALTLLIACAGSGPTGLRWTLSSPGPEHDDPTSVHGRAQRCAHRITAATVRLPADRVPVTLEVRPGSAARVLVTVIGVR